MTKVLHEWRVADSPIVMTRSRYGSEYYTELGVVNDETNTGVIWIREDVVLECLGKNTRSGSTGAFRPGRLVVDYPRWLKTAGFI